MVRTITRIAEQLGNPLEWHAVDKGILLCWVVIPLYALYITFCVTVLLTTTDGALFHHDSIRLLLDYLFALIAGNLAIGTAGLWLRRHNPDSTPFQHLAVQFYAVTMSLLGYAIGSLSLTTGIVLAGSPLVGFIFFERRAVLAGFVSAMAIVFGTSLASGAGLLPYAPVLTPQAIGGETAMPWVLNTLLVFAAPHILLLFSLSAYVIHRWHQREREVKELAIIDPLTGAANRRWIMDELEREVERSQRHDRQLSVVMVDLDHFKAINDRHGHQVGDRVLRTVASVLMETVRKSDLVGRYGGEEFLLLLPDTDARAAREVAERCRQQIAATRAVVGAGTGLTITASLGIGSRSHSPLDADHLVREADQALYRAKESGRNCIVTAAAD